MKKRVISLVLALTLALGLTLPAGAAGRATAEPGTPLAAEEGVSAFIAGDGALYTCGLNLGYQLGYEQTNSSTTIAGIGTADKEAGLQNKFAKVMDDVVAVDFGWNQAAAIKSDGSLWMWGSAYAGQLGFKASGDYQTIPRKVMDGVAQVSCGGNFTAAVKTDGSLWTWGYGYDGRLGNGNTGDTGNPQHIMDDVVQVSCGVDYAAAIKSDGSLWTWGSNRVGQLGFEPVTSGTGLFASTEPQLTPKKILSSGAAYIECGNSAMALIKTDGSLWTWGENSEGVLGNGTQKDTWEHQHILDDVVQVALNLSPCSTAYAIQSDGSLWAWGSNNSDYAGFEGGNATNGGWPVQTVPKKILDRAVRVATGGMHTIALMDDGTLWAWGYNNNGVQGRGSNLPICYSPSKVLDNMLSASGTEETPSAPVAGFSDVRASDYFADAVAWAAEKGVTTGTSATAFSPKDTVTRAEAVTFLWRAAGKPEPASSASPFSDVAIQSAYYYKAVLWAVEQGITQGVGGGRFDLTGTLTYEQILAFLCRAAGESADGDDWSAAAVSWAKNTGLTDGLSFSAQASCPRSDVVYCLWKQLGETLDEPVEEQPEDELLSLNENQALAADIMDALTNGYSKVDLTGYDVDLNDARELAEELADVLWENPYQVERIVGAMDLSGKALHLTIEYIGGSAIGGASRAAMEKADAIVAQVVTSGMSDYDIAKALHDYLALNCAYDYDNYLRNTIPAASYTAEGALLNGTAVCSGYAKAYVLLMERAGIPCEYVSGYAGGSHGWNVVQIDGEWYHVDVTWDDPVPNREGYVRYDYFLKSDSYMRANRHTRWTSSRTCTSTKYDGLDLPDSTEQIKQEAEQAVLDQVLPICYAALEKMPGRTQAELQALDDDTLKESRYFYIDLSGSGIDASGLSQYQRNVAQTIEEQYENLQFYRFDRTNMCIQIYRRDVAAEIQRRSDEIKAQKEEEKAQQDAETAAAKEAVQQVLRQVLPAMDSRDTTAEVPGYSKDVLQKACTQLHKESYSFDGYAYSTDYRVSASGDGVISITSWRWVAEENQRYVDLIDAAIDRGELRITLQGGNYPEFPDKPWYYAATATSKAGAAGHTTPGGLVAGEDYTLRGTIDSKTEEYTVTITYLQHGALTEEDFIAQIQDAIRNGKARIQFQYEDTAEKIAFQNARAKVASTGFDGYVPDADYNISSYSIALTSKVITLDIVYPEKEQTQETQGEQS